jgi:hypothetical protein
MCGVSNISFKFIKNTQVYLLSRQDQRNLRTYLLVAVTSSRILKAKQKLGVTFNSDNQDVIDFMKFLKMTMCRASEANSEK